MERYGLERSFLCSAYHEMLISFRFWRHSAGLLFSEIDNIYEYSFHVSKGDVVRKCISLWERKETSKGADMEDSHH